MKKLYPLTLLIITLVLVFVFVRVVAESVSRVSVGDFEWKVEVVESLKDRARGLSGREELFSGHGMLFIFPTEDLHGIWMKEMQFPIDIVWINKDFEVVDIKSDARPESFPKVFKSKAPASFVLEINSGEAEKAKINIKDIVRFF